MFVERYCLFVGGKVGEFSDVLVLFISVEYPSILPVTIIIGWQITTGDFQEQNAQRPGIYLQVVLTGLLVPNQYLRGQIRRSATKAAVVLPGFRVLLRPKSISLTLICPVSETEHMMFSGFKSRYRML